MPVSERDRARLSALLATVRPSHSLAARVQTLNDNDRAIYEIYRERMSAFIARTDIDEDGNRGNAYAVVLRGHGPRLPETITTLLNGVTPKITATDTDDNAARKFMEYANAR
jgi:hypothetical protein